MYSLGVFSVIMYSIIEQRLQNNNIFLKLQAKYEIPLKCFMCVKF